LDDAQLQLVFERYGYLVHRRCAALLRDAVAAEDAMQDVFLRVSRYGDSHRGGSMLSWLYSIAFNVCCDQLKRRRREQLEAPEVLAARGPVVGTIDEGDRRAAVSATLRSVGRRTREMVVLHFLDGMTQEEVAEASGYSRKTVGKKLGAFLALLRTRWQQGDER
jgi:RNA polymerase sigma-70 factor (ECF subfamily)